MAGRNVTLQFGLLAIPASAEVATIKMPDMVNLCTGQPGKPDHEHQPLRAPKVCPTCGPVVDYDVLTKGIKTGSTYTIIEREALTEAKVEYAKEYKKKLTLVPHPAQQFLTATAPGDSLHYLTPADAASADHYQLLVKLIESHPELAFVSLHTPVSATALYRVTVREGVLVMEKRVREGAVKPAPSVGGEVNDALYGVLEMMLDSFVTDYDPDAYEDQYAKAVETMLTEGEQVGGAVAATSVAVTDDELIKQLRALQEVST